MLILKQLFSQKIKYFQLTSIIKDENIILNNIQILKNIFLRQF